MAESLTVRPGDPITAEIWNRLVQSAEGARILYGGDNTRTTQTPHGSFVNAKHVGGHLHPWRVVASRESASVWPGLINGETPKMLDKKTGKTRAMTDRPAPLLPLTDSSFHNNVGWIALELETKEYKLITKASVIQCQFITSAEQTTSNPFFYFGLAGIGPGGNVVRYPLARLQKVASRQFVVHQVAMFNLNWSAKPPQPQGGGTGSTATGSAFPRHFFWAT